MSNRFQLVADHAMADFSDSDPWGSAMSMFFDVAAVLHMSSEVVMGADGYHDYVLEAFARWQYSPSPYVSVPDLESVADSIDDEQVEDYGTVALAHALVNGFITQDDLLYAGNVLDRYTNLLRANGMSY